MKHKGVDTFTVRDEHIVSVTCHVMLCQGAFHYLPDGQERAN